MNMKRIRNIISLLLVAVLLAGNLPVTAFAALSGTCGEDLTWELSGGTLTISGTGPMEELDQVTPWYHENITSVIIGSGVTYIDLDLFFNKSQSIGHKVTGIWVDEGNTCYSSDDRGVLFNKNKTELLLFPMGQDGEYSIANTVTTIGPRAFRGSNLTDIEIPNSVTAIGNDAFSDCDKVTEFVLPNSITTIPAWAFASCDKLEKITIPNGVTAIGDYAFRGCSSLGEVTLPNNLATIGEGAFSDCTWMWDITIPAGVTSIGPYAFSGIHIHGWHSIWVGEQNAHYSSDGFGVLFNKNKTELIQMPNGFCGAYYVPISVTTIAPGAFRDAEQLSEVTISANVKTIGTNAFFGCDGLRKITFEGDAPTIEEYAFRWLDSEVYYPAGNSSWTTEVFSKFDEEMTFHTFDQPQIYLASGEFGEGLSWILTKDGLLNISGVGPMPNYTFSSAPWTQYWCNILSVVIEDGITAIGGDSFSVLHNLREVEIPDSVTSIDMYGFSNCSKLKEITIPADVSFIGYGAFENCSALSAIYFKGSAPVFSNTHPLVFIQAKTTAYYPMDDPTWTEAVRQDYGGELTWTPYDPTEDPSEAVVAEGACGDNLKWSLTVSGRLTVSGLGPMEQYGHTNFPWQEYMEQITLVHIKQGVTSVSDFAFYCCSNLTKVLLPEGLSSVGKDAFYGCRALQHIWFPNTVTTINAYAFYDCDSLTVIQLPNSVSSIGGYAFGDCANLASINIPGSVTSIGDDAFFGCPSLNGIWVEKENAQYFSDSYGALFDRNNGRITLIAYPAGSTSKVYAMPNGTVQIGSYAFHSCSGLVTVVLPKSLTNIDDYAFFKCGSLNELKFTGNAPVISENGLYSVNATGYYSAIDDTWPKAVTKNYGGQITWIAQDMSIDIDANVDLRKKTDQTTLTITAKTINDREPGDFNKIISTLRKDLSDVTFESILGSSTPADGIYSISLSDAARQDIVLKKDTYQDYIIPKAVSASFVAAFDGYQGANAFFQFPHTAYMQPLTKRYKPYISTVFGRVSGSTEVYQNLQFQQLDLEEDTLHDIIISAVGLAPSGATYYIEQDRNHRLESDTGVFQAADLYNTLVFGRDVYAYAKDADGTLTTAVKLNIVKKNPKSPEVKSFLESSKFSLLGKDGQVIEIPEEFPLVGGGKISLEAFQAPLGIDVDGNDIRISFGVDVFQGKKEFGEAAERKNIFETFKDEFSSLSSNMDKSIDELLYYESFMKKYQQDGESNAYYEGERNWDVAFLGYATATVIDGQLVFKEILLNVKGKFMFQYTQQGAIWVIPAYYYVQAGAELSASTNWARPLPDPDLPMEFGIAFGITPKLRLGGGAGVKGAVSGGIWGEGTLPFTLDCKEKHILLKMTGQFGIEGEFFILKGDMSLLSGEHILYDKYYGISDAGVAAAYGSSASEASVSVVSRDYTESTTEWLGDQPAISTFAAADGGMTLRPLQFGVFSSSQPQVASCGDGLIMVWVEDDTTRDTYNRMRLVYSLYDSSTDTWSQAQPVCDDGHNDAYPSLVSDGSRVYVAWQKIDKTLTAEDCTGVDVLLANSEVFLAEFDAATKAFRPAQQLTDNDLYEYALTAALENGEPTVYYASAAGAQINQAGAHTLYRHGASAAIVETERNYILSLDTLDGQVSYCMDTDGDLSTTADVSAFTVQNDVAVAFGKEALEGPQVFTAYGMLGGQSTLFVSDLSNIYYMENSQRKTVFDSYRSIAGNINIVQGAAGTQIFWTETSDTGNELYMVSYTNGVWTQPVQISRQGETLRDVDITSLNGTPIGVCNADTVDGDTGLCFFTVNDFTDIAIADYFYFDESTAVPGQTQSFDVTVSNLGTTKVTNLNFVISDGLGRDQTVTKTVDLGAGDTQRVTLNYTVPDNFSSTTLVVTASLPNAHDADPDNNTASVSVGKVDLAVHEQAVHTFEDCCILDVILENQSLVAAQDVTLQLILGDESNEPSRTLTVGTLSRDTYADLEIAVPAEQMIFDEAGIARIYLRVASSSEDAADADNTVCILITKSVRTECAHTEVAYIPGQDPTCTEDGYTPSEVCAVCGETLVPSHGITPLGHSWDDGEVTKPATETADGEMTYTCTHCGETVTESIPALKHTHAYTAKATAPTCTAKGYTTHTCSVCGSSYQDSETAALGHNMGQWTVVKEATPAAKGSEQRKCSRCGYTETRELAYAGNVLMIKAADLLNPASVWIDGVQCEVIQSGNACYIALPEGELTNMVSYSYNENNPKDIHTQYPTGMRVWRLTKNTDGTYSATYVKELDNILQYSGSSIRITGKKGIRMITSITKGNKSALTGKGLAGYKLVEYGTALCWAKDLDDGRKPMVLGQDYVKSNYAYKRGVADPVFAQINDLVQYTNVLVGFTLDQCKDDIAMRPYIILEDANGQQITLYGGIVYRSIGYIAYQNRNVFQPGTSSYRYVWEIIRHVYGTKYDAEYKG